MPHTTGCRVRDAVVADANALAAIYEPYVRETAITFELEPPSADAFRERFLAKDPRHPWLVAEDGIHGVVAYAYASTFRARPAYRFSAETTVYVERGQHRRGVGRALMDELLARLHADDFHTVIAGVTLPNEASVCLHETLGFARVGVFRECGRKFDRWHDVGFWERHFNGELASPYAARR